MHCLQCWQPWQRYTWLPISLLSSAGTRRGRARVCRAQQAYTLQAASLLTCPPAPSPPPPCAALLPAPVSGPRTHRESACAPAVSTTQDKHHYHPLMSLFVHWGAAAGRGSCWHANARGLPISVLPAAVSVPAAVPLTLASSVLKAGMSSSLLPPISSWLCARQAKMQAQLVSKASVQHSQST